MRGSVLMKRIITFAILVLFVLALVVLADVAGRALRHRPAAVR